MSKRKTAKAPAGPPKPKGRPSEYTPVIAERICALIAEGRSLRQVCDMEGMPVRSAVYVWLAKHDGFADQYARACETRSEGYAEEIVDIADRTDLDPNSRRVMVDARKWVAAKLLPRKYGESVTLKGDKDNPLHIKRAVDLSDHELVSIAAGDRALDG